jgi:hypothetical protein
MSMSKFSNNMHIQAKIINSKSLKRLLAHAIEYFVLGLQQRTSRLLMGHTFVYNKRNTKICEKLQVSITDEKTATYRKRWKDL